MANSCSVSGCQRKYYALGFCEMHWRRNRKYGSPLEGRNHAPLEERFWRYVDKRDPDECWEWTAKRERNGYGRIQVGGKGSSQLGAHRVSFRLANGYDPEVVMHSCDNPACVNPAHLKSGTYSENTQDMIRKGRWRGGVSLGTDNALAKLDPDKVRFIRANPDMTHAALARMFGVGCTVIRMVRSGRTWKHVT